MLFFEPREQILKTAGMKTAETGPAVFLTNKNTAIANKIAMAVFVSANG